MERFEGVDMPDQKVAAVHRVVPMAELPSFFGEAFQAVAAAVEAAGGVVAGPPFGWYHGMPGDTVNVSAGFPVEGWDANAGEVRVSARGGGRAVVALHVGPYDTLRETYEALLGWCAEMGLSPTSDVWEEYLSAPEGDPSTWQTRIVWPIAS